ncbi:MULTISPECIES: hypothetical protein [Cyanophyceae]|uniref:hypothetical protein n=1 Tax=Cyanophyceae TaxID=3028117 RepID=UPI0016873030|nr:hypothetical protein [Trichocoleus sp. FACHB-40]MBD2003041.1 hypothetical protein [Trichocoleus sp. FACHB-40]
MIKKLLAFLAIVIGTPIVLFFLLFLTTGGIPVPTEPDWLYDWEFRSEVKADRLIGGGYTYIFDGRDIWIRFHVKEELPPPKYQGFYKGIRDGTACNRQELETIRQWFSQVITQQNKLFGLISLFNRSAEDIQNLNEVENLECYFTQQPKHKFGQIPPTSIDGYWVVFNKRTQFIYVRYWSYT